MKLILTIILLIFQTALIYSNQETGRAIYSKLKNLETKRLIDSASVIVDKIRDVNPSLSIELGEIVLKEVNVDQFPISKADLIDRIGIAYRVILNYDKSISYHFKALKIYEENSDSMGMAFVYSNIGSAYYTIQDFKKAKFNFKKSLKIKEKLEDEKQICFTLNKLGLNYSELNQLDSAYLCLGRAKTILEKIPNCNLHVRVYSSLGQIKLKEKNLLEAEKYFLDAYQISIEINDVLGIVLSSTRLAKTYQLDTKYRKSQKYLKNALKNAKRLESKIQIGQIYLLLSENYEILGNIKKSKIYLNEYIKISDEIHKSDRMKEVSKIEMQYNLKNKERENQLLIQQNRIDQLNLSKRNTQLLFLLSIALIGVIFLLVIIRRNKKIRKINKTLLEKEKSLRKLNDELSELVATKDTFFSIIAHDLKNPFQFLMSVSSLLNKNQSELDKDEMNYLLTNIEKISTESYELLSNMLNWASIETGKLIPKNVTINMGELLKVHSEKIQQLADVKKINIKYEEIESLSFESDPEMLSLVIRNLLINSIKYTKPGGNIYLSGEELENSVRLIVRDEGIGMEDSVLENLFSPDVKKSVKGTEDEKGSGLGLILCKEMVEKLNGSIKAVSSLGKGSVFTIEFSKNIN